MASEAEIIALVGIVFGAIGIAAIWAHPIRWKVVGTVLAIIGLVINAGNIFGFLEKITI